MIYYNQKSYVLLYTLYMCVFLYIVLITNCFMCESVTKCIVLQYIYKFLSKNAPGSQEIISTGRSLVHTKLIVAMWEITLMQ